METTIDSIIILVIIFVGAVMMNKAESYTTWKKRKKKEEEERDYELEFLRAFHESIDKTGPMKKVLQKLGYQPKFCNNNTLIARYQGENVKIQIEYANQSTIISMNKTMWMNFETQTPNLPKFIGSFNKENYRIRTNVVYTEPNEDDLIGCQCKCYFVFPSTELENGEIVRKIFEDYFKIKEVVRDQLSQQVTRGKSESNTIHSTSSNLSKKKSEEVDNTIDIKKILESQKPSESQA